MHVIKLSFRGDKVFLAFPHFYNVLCAHARYKHASWGDKVLFWAFLTYIYIYILVAVQACYRGMCVLEKCASRLPPNVPWRSIVKTNHFRLFLIPLPKPITLAWTIWKIRHFWLFPHFIGKTNHFGMNHMENQTLLTFSTFHCQTNHFGMNHMENQTLLTFSLNHWQNQLLWLEPYGKSDTFDFFSKPLAKPITLAWTIWKIRHFWLFL